MRISDWSSDVCSSDLLGFRISRDKYPRSAAHTHATVSQGLQVFRARPSFRHHSRFFHRAHDPLHMTTISPRRPDNLHDAARPMLPPVVQHPRPCNWRATSCTCLTHCCDPRSEEHTSELQSLMRISYAV